MESLNDLIASARAILDSGFDVDAFLTWRELALLCLLGLMGPLHYYTKSFARFTEKPDERGLLAGRGLLAAAREHVAKTANSPSEGASVGGPPPHDRFSLWRLGHTKSQQLTDVRHTT